MGSKLKRSMILSTAVGLLLTLSGCLEGSAVRTGAVLPPKPAYAPIDVFLDDHPAGPYTEIGLVSAKGSGHDATLTDVILVLQDQTRSLGADAVIVTDTWYEDKVHYDKYGDAHVHTRLYANGIAIQLL